MPTAQLGVSFIILSPVFLSAALANKNVYIAQKHCLGSISATRQNMIVTIQGSFVVVTPTYVQQSVLHGGSGHSKVHVPSSKFGWHERLIHKTFYE